MINNRNAYLREYNNWGDDSSMFLLYYVHLCDAVIDENIGLSSNNIPEIIDPVPSYIHVGGENI